jgi:protein N-terminal methyltransferase
MADAQINHQDARDYWQSIDADVNGMLGGFPYISKVDLQGSKNFLAKLGIGGKGKKKVLRAVDCGAGFVLFYFRILHFSKLHFEHCVVFAWVVLPSDWTWQQNRIGRITEGLLLSISETVDIVEPIAKFSDNLKGKAGVGEIFNVGLEDWSPSDSEHSKYDLIWNQWCLGHLTDAQLLVYLEKCVKVLKEGGWIVVKENMSTSGEDLFDDVDSSVTRYVLQRCKQDTLLTNLKGRWEVPRNIWERRGKAQENRASEGSATWALSGKNICTPTGKFMTQNWELSSKVRGW